MTQTLLVIGNWREAWERPWEFFLLLLNIPALFLLMYVSTIASVFTQFLGCILTGWRVTSLDFGMGPAKRLWHDSHLSIFAGLNVTSGYVTAYSLKFDHYKWRFFFITACGPLARTALIFFTAYFPFFMIGSTSVKTMLQIYVFVQVVMLAVALFSGFSLLRGHVVMSDGLLLWRILRMDRVAVRASYIQGIRGMFIYYLQLERKVDAEALLEKAFISPGEELEIRTAWVYQVSAEGVERIKAEAVHLLALLETDKDRQVIALDSLACIPIFGGPSELLDDALAWIERALAERPDTITFIGTKGSLLFEKGNVEEGLRLLEEVLEKTESDGDRAICKYYMALHHHRRGELQLAYRWLREAQEIGLESPVKSRVENELGGIK